MRTFPRELAAFRALVEERGKQLRAAPLDEVLRVGNTGPVAVVVESRPATVATIVQPEPNGSYRVVVQGFMKSRFLFGSSVALDGFYRHPDGTVAPMSDEELNEFG